MNTNIKYAPLYNFIFITLSFFLTSSSFITWYYRLASFYSPTETDIIGDVIAYLLHIVGILIFSLLVRRIPKAVMNYRTFLLVMAYYFIFTVLSIVIPNGSLILVFGLMANTAIGMIFGYYLTVFSLTVPKNKRGIVFGLAGACGSISAYLLSIPGEESFLMSNNVLIVYAVLAVIVALVGRNLLHAFEDKEFPPAAKPDIRFIVFCGLTILLVNGVQNMGFYFPSVDITQAGISLEFSRAFYAIGLVTAGFISDKSRSVGLIISSPTLVFPFISLLLLDSLAGSLTVWILAYVVIGFFSISRILLFADHAADNDGFYWLAALGMMFGRGGEALGAFLGVRLSPYRIIHISVTTVFFFAAVIFLFLLYHKLYVAKQVLPDKTEDPLSLLKRKYSFSSREEDVFQLLTEDISNKEIAQRLFISENTVKFHIKNIYRKTGCSNRKDLAALLYEGKKK